MEGLVFPFISFNFGLLGPKFSSPAARFKGLRQGGGTACTEIATLAVTIMPAWSEAHVDVQHAANIQHKYIVCATV